MIVGVYLQNLVSMVLNMSTDKRYIVVVYDKLIPIHIYQNTPIIKYVFVKNTKEGFDRIRGHHFRGLIMDTFDLEDHLYKYLLSRVRLN